MRIGNTGALDQVVAHCREVLLKAVVNLRGVVRVVQLSDSVDGYALDPCAQGGEVCPRKGQRGQGDVCVLGHSILDS